MAEETRKVADEVLEWFQNEIEKAGLKRRDIKKQGASGELIIEEMKYHDRIRRQCTGCAVT